MEITVKQMQSLTYRKDRLQEKIRKLEFQLSGKGASFLPLIRTKSGRYSEKRTWTLVKDLLDALETYEKYKKWCEGECDGNIKSTDTPMAKSTYQMPEEARTYWQSFFYCAIRFAESCPATVWGLGTYRPDGLPWWGIETTGSFEDIFLLAGQVERVTKAELHFAELYHPEYLSGWFRWMDDLYEAFSGKPIVDTLSDTERRTVKELFPAESEQAERLQAEEEGLDPEEINRILAESDLEWCESMGISEAERQQEMDEHERLFQMREDWVRSFPNKETFCQQYLAFRTLFFKMDYCRDFCSMTEHAIDIYLYERNASGYLDDDAFFSAYALITKVIEQIQEFSEVEASQ